MDFFSLAKKALKEMLNKTKLTNKQTKGGNTGNANINTSKLIKSTVSVQIISLFFLTVFLNRLEKIE